MRLTCGHDDEEGFVCGRCVSEALDRLGEVRFLARRWEDNVSPTAAFCGAYLNQMLDAEHSVLRARKREREERDAAFRAGVLREMGWRDMPTTIGGRDGQ